MVNAAEPLDAVLRRHFPWCAEWADDLRCLFESYVEAKQRQHVLDYDDLLLYWGELMQVPELARQVGDLFDHVLVDEYQDTNALQASILLGLKPDGRGLTVVGDDAQAIYGFRAASVRNILDFPRLFEPPATVVTLEQNYRSTRHILDASNAVIGLARERFTKNLRSDRASGGKPALVTVLDDAGQVDCVATTTRKPRGRHSAQAAGGPVPHREPQRHAGDRAEPPQHPVRQVRRPQIRRGGPRQGPARRPALGREPVRPRDGFPRPAAARRHRSKHGRQVLDRMAGRTPRDALLTIHPPARAAEAGARCSR